MSAQFPEYYSAASLLWYLIQLSKMIKFLTFLIVASCLLMMTSSGTRAASLGREGEPAELLKTLFPGMRSGEDHIVSKEDPKQTRSIFCPVDMEPCVCYGSCWN
ncbi:hypothetical protein V1264_005504 [Littorina saxatilis]|uniref:Uncharacterized protein n=1 Tax=Littorina saxatilis TaxID=31220 RepID=A0AAN9AZ52_9CAEN